jgi:beta-glucanase (GH16 family)
LRPKRLIRLLAVLLLVCVLVPASPAGASSGPGCDLLRSLLGVCSSPPVDAVGPPSACGGEVLSKPDGSAWACTFDDEFAGAELDRSVWTVQTTAQFGFHSGDECMVDDPANIVVADGRLKLTVRDTGTPFTCASPRGAYTTRYTGASVYTSAFTQEYGRFEIRARFAEGGGTPGLQGSLWLFPRAAGAAGVLSGVGEIDIAEAYSRWANLVAPTVHGASALILGAGHCTVPDYGADFHTYAAEWNRSGVTFSYDGVPCFRVATALGLPPNLRAPDPFLVALTQALGVGSNRDDAGAPLPATLQVDYVRVWK